MTSRVFQQCKHVMNSQKRKSRDAYFSCLSYSSIVSVRPKGPRIDFHGNRREDKAAVYSRLYTDTDDGCGNTILASRKV